MKLFSGFANPILSQAVADQLDISLSSVDEHVFADGERRIRIPESVVGEQTVVIQSAATPVDTNYMELFFIVDALKRSGSEFVTAVIPYFGYQRQDHIFRDGEAVSLEVVIKILQSVGVDKMISFDMHTPKIPSLFHIPVAHLSALPLFAEVIKKQQWNSSDTILVSPDKGGVGRVKKLSELLGNMTYVAMQKNRDVTTGKIAIEGVIEGSLSGKKRAIILDDMMSSGKTILLVTDFLKKEGIEEVIVFATHAIFSEDASEKLQSSDIKKVYVTDTVVIEKDKQFPKLEILSIAQSIAEELTHPTSTNQPLLG